MYGNLPQLKSQYFLYGVWKTELKIKGLIFAYGHLFVYTSR